MSNQKKQNELTIEQAVQPVVECKINFRNQRMLLHEMFASVVSHAHDSETENFTAKRFTPFYLALCQLLENLDDIDEVHDHNVLFL